MKYYNNNMQGMGTRVGNLEAEGALSLGKGLSNVHATFQCSSFGTHILLGIASQLEHCCKNNSCKSVDQHISFQVDQPLDLRSGFPFLVRDLVHYLNIFLPVL